MLSQAHSSQFDFNSTSLSDPIKLILISVHQTPREETSTKKNFYSTKKYQRLGSRKLAKIRTLHISSLEPKGISAQRAPLRGIRAHVVADLNSTDFSSTSTAVRDPSSCTRRFELNKLSKTSFNQASHQASHKPPSLLTTLLEQESWSYKLRKQSAPEEASCTNTLRD